MGLFKKIVSGIFGGGKNPAQEESAAFKREMARIKAQRVEERKNARFARTEGKGIAREAEFEFGNEDTFDDLTDTEIATRSSGRLRDTTDSVDTGLIL